MYINVHLQPNEAMKTSNLKWCRNGPRFLAANRLHDLTKHTHFLFVNNNLVYQHLLDGSIAQCPRNAFQKWRKVFAAQATGWITWSRKTACFSRCILIVFTVDIDIDLQKMIGGKNLLHCIRMWMITVGELCVAFIYKNANID